MEDWQEEEGLNWVSNNEDEGNKEEELDEYQDLLVAASKTEEPSEAMLCYDKEQHRDNPRLPEGAWTPETLNAVLVENFGDEHKERIAAAQQKREEAQRGARRHRRVLRDNIQGITKHHINRLAARGGCVKVSQLIYEEIRGVTKVFLESILRDTITFTEHERSCTVAPEHVLSACARQGRMMWGTGRLPLGSIQSVHPYQPRGPDSENPESSKQGGFLHEFTVRRAENAAERAEKFGELFPCSTLTFAKYSRVSFSGYKRGAGIVGFEKSIEEHEKQLAEELRDAENSAKEEALDEEAGHKEEAEAERAQQERAKQEDGYVPLSDEQEKNRRLHSQSLALIRTMQCEENSAKRVIPYRSLAQLCTEIGQNFKTDFCFSPVAINLLGELLETYLVGLFGDSKLNAVHIHMKRIVTDTSLLVGKRVRVKRSANRTHPGVFDSVDDDGNIVVLYDDGGKKSYALRTSEDGHVTTTFNNEKEQRDVHRFFVEDGSEFFGEEQKKERIAAMQQKHREVQAARGTAKGGADRRHPRVLRDSIQGITKHHINRLAARGGCIKVSQLIYEEIRGVTRIFLESILKDTITLTEHERPCTVAQEHVLSACARQGHMLWGTGRLPLPLQSVHPYQFKGPDSENPDSQCGGFLHEFTVRKVKNAAENLEYSQMTYAKYSRCAFDGSIEEHEKEVAKATKKEEKNTSHTYYYHAASSGKSQWERPTLPPPGAAAASPAASPVVVAVSLTEKQEKNRCLHSQSLELVRKMQRSTERVIPCILLTRLCMEIGQNFKTDLCFSPGAINLLGEFLEIYLVGLFENSILNAIRGERIAVEPKDIQMARRIRGERS